MPWPKGVSKQVFTQPIHSCGPTDVDEGSVTLEVMDAGGGAYLVLHATHWAFDGMGDVEKLVEEIKKMLP